jgi:hypothetical protein
VTIETLRQKLHAEIKRTDAAFARHIKKNNCRIDGSGCTDRAKYQERLATLNYVLILAGGRANGVFAQDSTTIEE